MIRARAGSGGAGKAFGAMAFDSAHGRLYVSGGKSDSRVAILTADGRLEKTLTNLPGASGLAFDTSFSTLYVSLSSGEIAKINTTSESESGRFSVAPYVSNGQMAFAGGRLWFGQSCGQFAPVVHVNVDGTGLGVSGPTRYCPIFASTPSHPELLAVSEIGLSPSDAYLYRVDGGGFVLQATTANRPFGGGASSMAFNGGGSVLFAASGAPYEIQSFRGTDLSKTVGYSTDAYPIAVATSGDAYIAGGRDTGTNDPDLVDVFGVGNPVAVKALRLPADRDLVTNGLAFTGTDTLAVVSKPRSSTDTGTIAVHTFSHVTTPLRAAAVKLTASARSVLAGRRVTLTAHLPSGATGTVTFFGNPALTSTRTVSKGIAKLTVRIDHTSTFTFTYSGDDAFDTAKSGSVRIIARSTVTLTAISHRRSYKVGSQPKFLLAVRPPRAADVVVELQYRISGRWATVQQKSFTTTSAGVTVIYIVRRTIAGQYRLRAQTGGGESRALSSWVRFDLVR
jgi:Bacterial Ig-like domain (group 3)